MDIQALLTHQHYTVPKSERERDHERVDDDETQV